MRVTVAGCKDPVLIPKPYKPNKLFLRNAGRNREPFVHRSRDLLKKRRTVVENGLLYFVMFGFLQAFLLFEDGYYSKGTILCLQTVFLPCFVTPLDTLHHHL